MSPEASKFGSDHTLTKNITLTYTEGGITGTTSYDIRIINDIRSISIHNPITKTTYNINDTLDLTGGEILVTRAIGTPEAVSLTDSNVQVTGFNSSTEESGQTLTVSYTENGITKTTNFSVDIVDSVSAIAIEGTPKTNYQYGESLESLTISVTKGSGTTTIPVTNGMISGYDKNTLGTQTVTITYGGKTTSFQVEVKDYVKSITVQSPTKTTYDYGQDLNLAGGTVTPIMASGTQATPIPLTDVNVQVTGYNATTLGEQTITVTYQGKTNTFQVEVKDDISNMALQGTPIKNYEYGDPLDVSGMTIKVTRPSGDTIVSMDDSKIMVEGYDATKIGTQTVTIKYDGKVVTTYEVTVSNPVTKVELGTTPKTSYEVGDELDVTDGTLVVTRKNNTTETVNITKDMITGFDSSAVVTGQILTITYVIESKTYEVTYSINVIEQIQSIAIQDLPKQDYLYGDSLDITGGTILVAKGSGGTETISITADMVTEEDGSPFDSTNLTARNLKVTYGNKTTTYAITVSDYIVDITLTPPNKTEYQYGDTLDLTGGAITKIMASGATSSEVMLTDSKVQISGFDNTKTGTQAITVTYTENGKAYEKQYSITLDDPVTNIRLDTAQVPTTYYYGDNLDLSNAKVIVEYASGKQDSISVTTGMISGYNATKLGEQTVSVSYLGTENNFTVQVLDYIKDITLTPPTKVEYQYNETLNLAGGSITEVMASGATGANIALATSIVTGFDSTTPGTKTLIVTYVKDSKTFQKQFQVIVYNDVDRIEVISPQKTNYQYGENLDLTGAKIKTIREDGTEELIPITNSMVTGYSKTTPGQQVITVTYTDEKGNTFQGNFTVQVGEDYVKTYQFTKPTKTIYEIGETLDLTGGKITEVYASGRLGNEILLTQDMVTGFESTTPGTKKIKVTYQGKEYSFQVQVKDEILGISIKKSPNKLDYQKGENLNLSGATLIVIKKSGTVEIPITKNMVSGYDKNKVGMQAITVTYEGFTTQFVVHVEKPVTTPSTGGNTNRPNTNGNNTKPTQPNDPTDNIVPPTDENQPPTEIQPPQDNDQGVPPIGIVDNNTPNPPSGNNTSGSGITTQTLQYILATIVGLLTVFIILLLALKFKKNVEIYIEEGEERVLVGKARVTKDNRVLDLSKYCDKYQEENYKLYVTEAATKKLDNQKLEVIVKNKIDTFKVKYHKDGCEYKV